MVRTIKTQKGLFRREDRELSREEYEKLLTAAKAAGKTRLWHILQAICSTGIRVSELRFITAEAVRMGYADVNDDESEDRDLHQGNEKSVLLLRAGIL